MKKNLIGFIVSIALVLSLTFVGIAKASSLTQSQVNAIVSLLQAFGADSGTIANVTATLNGQPTNISDNSTVTSPQDTTTVSGTGVVPGSGGSGIVTSPSLDNTNNSTVVSTTCIDLNHDETYGSTDADTNGEVSVLQNFLRSNNYLSAGPSGFFGAMTKVALINYQLANGITPAAGYLGAPTRMSIYTQTCGTVIVGTDLKVSLSPNSPSGNVVAGSTNVELIKLKFTNTSATNAIVSGLTLVSQNATIYNQFIIPNEGIDNQNRTLMHSSQTGSGIFLIDFNVPANSSVVLSVRGDVSSVAVGQTASVSLAGVTTNIPISASFPISSNPLTIVSEPGLTGNSITIVSPIAGSSYPLGVQIPVSWNMSNSSNSMVVSLNSVTNGKVYQSYPFSGSAGLNVFANGVSSNAGSKYGGQYTVKVCDTINKACADSEQFKIVGLPTTSSIKLLSPNGGETLSLGSTVNISWNTTGTLTSNYRQVVNLYKGNDNIYQPCNLNNVGNSCVWNIPTTTNTNNTDITSGGNNYSIGVSIVDTSTGQTIASDASDSLFTISAPVTAQPIGVCTIRNSYSNLPNFSDSDVGVGYAKYSMGNVADINETKNKCNDDIFNSLMVKYCASNKEPVQWGVAIYPSVNGGASISSCAESGCQSHTCPSETSIVGTDLTVSLSPTSPTGNIVVKSTNVVLAQFTFTNTSAIPAIVSNLSFSSGNTANVDYKTTFTVPANSSYTLDIRGDVDPSATVGQVISVTLGSASANIPVSASFPISSNTLKIVANASSSLTPNSNVATALEAISKKDLINLLKLLTGQK